MSTGANHVRAAGGSWGRRAWRKLAGRIARRREDAREARREMSPESERIRDMLDDYEDDAARYDDGVFDDAIDGAGPAPRVAVTVLTGADAERLRADLANACTPEAARRRIARARERRAEVMRPKARRT